MPYAEIHICGGAEVVQHRLSSLVHLPQSDQGSGLHSVLKICREENVLCYATGHLRKIIRLVSIL